MVAYLGNVAPWFAFLVHFRDYEDLHRFGGAAFLRRYSHSEAEFRTKMCSLPPMVAGEVGFGFATARGELIGVMRPPEVMLGSRAAQAVAEGLDLALQRGARVVGLGGLTAPATGGGLRLLRRVPAGVTLTNGNAYTAAVVRHNVAEASDTLGLGRCARVAVVGCTGSVGVPASHLLAESGFDLILIGRSAARVRGHLGELVGWTTIADNLDAVREADIVVLLTSDPSARLAPEQVRPGAVVIDCAQPTNVAASAYPAFASRRVAVAPGGIVRIPGYTCSVDFGLPAREETFACLAETYLFAREGIRDHSVGRPSPALARRLERVAQRHGVSPRPLDLGAHWPSVSVLAGSAERREAHGVGAGSGDSW